MVMREHQATLVLLFASWCAPCRAEIAAVRSLPEEERKKLGVIGLCLDENQDDAVAFVRDTDPDFPVFLAREGVLRTLGVRSIPLTILVDSNGTILDASVGLDEHFLEKVRTWIPSSP
jgi:cytochrome c biogenesis protein CcmG/thiol:disulfide interchange protein DsbE